MRRDNAGHRRAMAAQARGAWRASSEEGVVLAAGRNGAGGGQAVQGRAAAKKTSGPLSEAGRESGDITVTAVSYTALASCIAAICCAL
jgi:hypothetical protein